MTELSEPDVKHTPISVFKAMIRQLRPKQWTKNVLLFVAVVFSGRFTDPEYIVLAIMGFVAFCMVSSSGYIFNDYLDREADRRHPKKRFRPIASGALPVPMALLLMLVALTVGLGIGWSLGPLFLLVTLAYLATTLSYSFYFKHIVILDVMFIALGFVWRAIAGALAIRVQVSVWLFLITAFLALFIGFNKRRAELEQLGASGGTRKNLAEYSPRIIDQFQGILTANVILGYALYCALGPTPWMLVTIPHALYGVFRYIYLVEMCGEGAAPDETLLKDRPMQFAVLFYVVTVMAVLLMADANLLPEFPSD